ncbi:hypothetical protein ACOSP7_006874 [Xanthoceras sorbifolium]
MLNGGNSIKEFNKTNIVLIPKTKNLVLMKDFRPISFCSVVYKVVTKSLANRMKLVLLKIISDSQSAFVPGIVIFDNIFVAFEMLYTLGLRKKGRKGLTAIKLDMSKAYNHVE